MLSRAHWGALACAWAACVPTAEVVAPSDGQGFLDVFIDDAGAVVSVTGRAALGPRVVTSGGGRRYVLRYDVPLEDVAVTLDAAGRAELAAPDADDRRAWPLPPPSAWGLLHGGGLEFSSAPLPVELLAVRLARPPCPTLAIREVDLNATGDVRDLALHGDAALVSVLLPASDPERPFHRASTLRTVALLADAAAEVAVPEVLSGLDATFRPAHLFREGDQLRLVWGSNAGGPVRTFAITSTLGFIDERRLAQVRGGAPAIDEIAAFVEAGRVTTVYHAFQHELYASTSATAAFALVAREPAAGEACRLGTYTQVLELSSAHAGLVGMLGDGLWSFDLRARPPFVSAYGPDEVGPACRSARAVGPQGELLAWQGLPGGALQRPPTGIAWRRSPEDRWVPLDGAETITGVCAEALGDLYFVCAEVGRELALYQRDHRRPDLGPRFCGTVELTHLVGHLLATPAGLLAGGGDRLTWLVPPASD